jgi:hypothetical protein
MLNKITPDLIDRFHKEHDASGGNLINEKISRLFKHFPDNTCRNDVKIKVSVINTIYNTSIQYIDPVVEKINEVFSNENYKNTIKKNPENIVDLIATAHWVNNTSERSHQRKNLSFASKYMHFQSNKEAPIYDSYVWMLITAYLRKNHKTLSIGNPGKYSDFHDRYTIFKHEFDLSEYSNYEIDKFLWQYGRHLIKKITGTQKIGTVKARQELRRKLFST